jgi:hypothetical protein
VRRRLIAPLLSGLLLGAGCEDQSYRQIGGNVNVLVKRTDRLVPPARQRLVAFGRRAVPQIETAMHAAPEQGRLNLVAALEAIGDEEAIPILRHFSIYDPKAEVRRACEAVLKGWSVQTSPRAERARRAIEAAAQRRAAGEGPLAPKDAGASPR